jgi:predicted lipid-binding transport protein (Tim44 family)|tara:strand:- start:874 stop:1497 length:624 start_codon:yes stop_codon:yes gene_type:complete
MYIYQTMSNSFGYLDIILLAMIAGFIILRLRNILGRKTGHEDKIYDGFSDKKFDEFKEKIKSQTKKTQTEFDIEQKKQFLKGAEIAYETIINSFAKGDKKSLRDLLTKEMRENFESAIEERNSKNIKSELTFIGIKSSVIEKFEKTATALFFTVKFVSEIISVKKDKNENIIEGDPNKIKTVIDHWKFTRKTSSMNPNWYLVEIKNS